MSHRDGGRAAVSTAMESRQKGRIRQWRANWCSQPWGYCTAADTAGHLGKIRSTDAHPMLFPVHLSSRFVFDPLWLMPHPTQPPPSCTRLGLRFSISANFGRWEKSAYVRRRSVFSSFFECTKKPVFFKTGLIIGLDPLLLAIDGEPRKPHRRTHG